ncbi:MAG TPA: alpha/beta fold hydrolase [Thermoanaerobaculia bacterium]|nr:alpha/beta fold hydrolase [Thermoanaerobaculia bacterium]
MAAATVHPTTIEGPAGALEALWKEPEGDRRGAAVVAHAHPLHGGTMHFKVVFRIARALSRAGFGVMRFNFRGVGASQGRYDFGRGERDDFLAALDEAERRAGLPAIAAGFSFGSTVALAAGEADRRVAAIVAAGVPLARWNFEGVERIEKPALVISGDRDEYAGPAALAGAVERRFSRVRLVAVAGADHFFGGHLDALEEAIFAFASGFGAPGTLAGAAAAAGERA